jgi:hypothetical protein
MLRSVGIEANGATHASSSTLHAFESDALVGRAAHGYA